MHYNSPHICSVFWFIFCELLVWGGKGELDFCILREYNNSNWQLIYRTHNIPIFVQYPKRNSALRHVFLGFLLAWGSFTRFTFVLFVAAIGISLLVENDARVQQEVKKKQGDINFLFRREKERRSILKGYDDLIGRFSSFKIKYVTCKTLAIHCNRSSRRNLIFHFFIAVYLNWLTLFSSKVQ